MFILLFYNFIKFPLFSFLKPQRLFPKFGAVFWLLDTYSP